MNRFFDFRVLCRGAGGTLFVYCNEAIEQRTLVPKAQWVDTIILLAFVGQTKDPTLARNPRQWFKVNAGWVCLLLGASKVASVCEKQRDKLLDRLRQKV